MMAVLGGSTSCSAKQNALYFSYQRIISLCLSTTSHHDPVSTLLQPAPLFLARRVFAILQSQKANLAPNPKPNFITSFNAYPVLSSTPSFALYTYLAYLANLSQSLIS